MGTDEPSKVRSLVQRATQDLATRLQIPRSTLMYPRIESVFWNDTALGLPPLPKEKVFKKSIAGYRLLFDHHGSTYRYHTDEEHRFRYDNRNETGY